MRILFNTTRLPYPPLRGDQTIPLNRIRFLAARHEVSLLSFISDPAEEQFLSELAPYCKRVETVFLPKRRSIGNVILRAARPLPLQVSYFHSEEYRRKLAAILEDDRIDLVHTVLARAAEYTFPLKGVRKVAELIDALSLTTERRSQTERGMASLLYRYEAARMRRYEQRICDAFDRVLVVSEVDQAHLGRENVDVVRAGVALPGGPRVPEANTVVFSGNLSYFPNTDAAYFIVQEIMPLLRRRIPGIRMKLVGMNPTPELLEMCAGRPDIQITGFVKDISEHLLSADIVICPLRTGGAGMHLKVLEAMACGAPMVLSPLVSGFEIVPGRDVLVASTPCEYVDAIERIHRNPGLAAQMSANVRSLVERKYSWDSSSIQLERLYLDLVSSRPPNVADEPFGSLEADWEHAGQSL